MQSLRKSMTEQRQKREAMASEVELSAKEFLATAEEALTSRLPDHLRDCGVPLRIAEVIAGGLDDTAAVRAVKAFPASNKCFLVLAGQVGCGKSVAAAWALKNAKRKETASVSEWEWEPVTFERLDAHKGMYITAAQLAFVDMYSDEGREVLSNVATVPWLVLDELGSEQKDTKGRWMERLEHVLGTRYAECRKTVITTNLTSAALGERYEARIRDRLRDAAEFVSCGEKSLRGGR